MHALAFAGQWSDVLRVVALMRHRMQVGDVEVLDAGVREASTRASSRASSPYF
jgi:hypothetical protein